MSGPTINQACATSARLLVSAASKIEVDAASECCILAIAYDRTSNGLHLYCSDPSALGNRSESENWAWDNFNYDPYAGNAIIETAEHTPAEVGMSREEQDALTVLRYQQY